MTKFLCVWSNDNPSTYIEACNSEAELQSFLDGFNPFPFQEEDVLLYIIRGSDLAVAKVTTIEDGEKRTYSYKFE